MKYKDGALYWVIANPGNEMVKMKWTKKKGFNLYGNPYFEPYLVVPYSEATSELTRELLEEISGTD
jgi:hypothetical protein